MKRYWRPQRRLERSLFKDKWVKGCLSLVCGSLRTIVGTVVELTEKGEVGVHGFLWFIFKFKIEFVKRGSYRKFLINSYSLVYNTSISHLFNFLNYHQKLSIYKLQKISSKNLDQCLSNLIFLLHQDLTFFGCLKMHFPISYDL